ncbi:MAG: phage BR0599 family protein, partial [Rhodospirillales bacterium]|nr:phage BR0599 family protein [Rhodospirillales bacterium]
QIGQLRTLASAYYAQRSRRKVTQGFTLQGNDPFNLLRFFADMGGEQNNFWLGASLNEAALTADVTAAATSLTVDNGAALGTNAFVLLNDNFNRVPLAVASVAGNTWNLVASPGTAFAAAHTRVESLVLARFDDLKLTLNFSRPDLATATLKFCELPWETNAVAGETYGTTMGALPVTAILFVFTLTTPSGTTTWRYTNFERDLTNSGNTYTSAPFDFDTINETAMLDRQSLHLKSRNFTGNPLALLVPFQLEWPLMIQLIEADVVGSAASNLRTYFSGEVGQASVEPPFIDADCATLSSIFDRNLPRRLYQRTDNWVLFEPANGLNAADWQWNALVVDYTPATSTLTVGTITSSNGATLDAHFFSAGYLIITSAGGKQVRMISDNAAITGGILVLQLSTPLSASNPWAVGDVVNVFAGYDGQAATAIAKFNNYARFGGFPFMPIGNPSVLRITQPTGGGKK